MSTDLQRGREAYDRREWRAAREALIRADEQGALGPADLWRLALSAYLIGRGDEFAATLERAHRRHQEAGDVSGAARAAFWIGLHLAESGEVARATGWFGRAGRMLDEEGGDRVERGYLLLPAGQQNLAGGDYEAAHRVGGEAAAIAQRFDDADLLALAVHLQGRARVRQGRVAEGLALLDEAMVAVATGELSPQVTGLIYCSVISACRSVYALGRAREWTAALADWCDRQPDMVAYTGECRVYRSELMQLRGAWEDAIEEARQAGRRLDEHGGPTAALAHYQQGEVHRLRGEFAAAEEAYRAASRAGREPQPGLALLRLAQGDDDAAAAASRRALAETPAPLGRARLLPAHIEIMVAVGDIGEARRACEELGEIADTFGGGVLETLVARARGAVALADGEPGAALPDLRRAALAWQELGAPHEAARARLLLGRACRALGDEDGAALELEAARSAFQRLGAAPDTRAVDALTGGGSGGRRRAAGARHGLTPREREVLAAVATGRTNRAIAEELFISEKTVARHLSNIFMKLGLSSRAAATAYAYEHDLLGPSA